ncbi:MAG: threonylcarbamoyl-AMP synthase [Candidatus Aenigmarchaeota archaeon]|nr:threonylcarbamoyl-AMP synthase [Candidatus Aenigmarchaeota archaeon]
MRTMCCPWKKEYYALILETLKKGGVIAYPTETSYGLGVDATQAQAVQKLYALKERDAGKPVICIVDTLTMVQRYCTLHPAERRIIRALMPGPITLVAQAKGKTIQTAGNGTFSFRIPSFDVARALVHAYKKPITSTSANRSGNKPLYRIADVIREFYGKVDIIIDGGDLAVRKQSTVVKITDRVDILRQGPIAKNRIASVAFPQR